MTVVALILNLFTPLAHSASKTDSGDHLIEICTEGGIQYVKAAQLFPDQQTDQEDCPICAECPVCWIASPVKALATSAEFTRLYKMTGHASFESLAIDFVTRDLWFWPESRAPPALTV